MLIAAQNSGRALFSRPGASLLAPPAPSRAPRQESPRIPQVIRRAIRRRHALSQGAPLLGARAGSGIGALPRSADCQWSAGWEALRGVASIPLRPPELLPASRRPFSL